MTESTSTTLPKPIPSPKSTYETPEERAKRNIWNARMKSLELIIQLSIAEGSYKGATSNDLCDWAEVFEKWITRE